jgi:hypothetical protein
VSGLFLQPAAASAAAGIAAWEIPAGVSVLRVGAFWILKPNLGGNDHGEESD